MLAEQTLINRPPFLRVPYICAELIASFVCDMWEPFPTMCHKEALRQIGLDLIRGFGVCDQALLVASWYLMRLKNVFDASGIVTRDCSAQLFTVALLTACKFLYDVPPSNTDWAHLSHFDRRRLNQMEMELLEALHFSMFASPADVRDTLEHITVYSRYVIAPCSGRWRYTIPHLFASHVGLCCLLVLWGGFIAFLSFRKLSGSLLSKYPSSG